MRVGEITVFFAKVTKSCTFAFAQRLFGSFVSSTKWSLQLLLLLLFKNNNALNERDKLLLNDVF